MTTGLTPEKEWKSIFIGRLAETSNVTAACLKAKISRQRAYEVRNEDPLFAAAWKEALEIATENLELEARRRAEIGVLDPVFHMGARVGTIRKYSDTLMIFLLKAHAPDKYRENIKNDHGGEVIMRILYGDDGTNNTAT